MTGDFCMRIIFRYKTGPDKQFILPYSCLLRPVLLILQSASLRNVIHHFVITLVKSRDVFILAISFMTVAAAGSILLLQGRLQDQGFARGFDDFRWSFLTMFVFTSNGENYPDVVYPAAELNPWFRLYFIVFSLAGTFLLVSLLIAFFQRYYNAQYEARATANDSTNTVRRRAGILVAYMLLHLIDEKVKGHIKERHELESVLPFEDIETPRAPSTRAERRRNSMDSHHGRSRGPRGELSGRSMFSSVSSQSSSESPKKRHTPPTNRHRRAQSRSQMPNIPSLIRELRQRDVVTEHTYHEFAEACEVPLDALDELEAAERHRFSTFCYDTQEFTSRLRTLGTTQKTAGCDSEFLGTMASFSDRCMLWYKTARTLGRFTYDAAQFLQLCEFMSVDPDDHAAYTAKTTLFARTAQSSAALAGRLGHGHHHHARPTRSGRKDSRARRVRERNAKQRADHVAAMGSPGSNHNTPRASPSLSASMRQRGLASTRTVTSSFTTTIKPSTLGPFRRHLRKFVDNGYCIHYHSLIVTVWFFGILCRVPNATNVSSSCWFVC